MSSVHSTDLLRSSGKNTPPFCFFFCRAIQILPNKLIGEVGQHTAEYSVDRLCLNYNKQYLLSSSFDCVKLWPVERIPTVFINEREPDKDRRKRKKRKAQKNLLQLAKKKPTRDSSFFADL